MDFSDRLTRALRERSSDQLRVLLDETLAVSGDVDPRDLMLGLAPIHDCARRLGLDVPAFFRAAAEGLPAGTVRETAIAFGARTDIAPHGWLYALVDEPDGLRYRQS